MATSYLESRFLIPQQSVAAIIGPGGKNLSRLHMEYHAVVNISESVTSERVLTIGGFELLPICSMLNDILETITSASSERLGYGGESEICLLIDDSQVEPLTGREELQMLVEETGARIDVFPMCCPLSTERVLRVFGAPALVTQCIYGLCTLLKYCPSKPGTKCRQRYDANNADPSLAADYGGYVGDHACEVGDEGDIQQPTTKAVTSDSQTSESETSCILKRTIPANIAGAILGRNGTRLIHVQNESGAKVKLDDGIPGTNDRLITIIGTKEEAENAQLLLQMCVQYCCVDVP